jgi:hypothetical protein
VTSKRRVSVVCHVAWQCFVLIHRPGKKQAHATVISPVVDA